MEAFSRTEADFVFCFVLLFVSISTPPSLAPRIGHVFIRSPRNADFVPLCRGWLRPGPQKREDGCLAPRPRGGAEHRESMAVTLLVPTSRCRQSVSRAGERPRGTALPAEPPVAGEGGTGEARGSITCGDRRRPLDGREKHGQPRRVSHQQHQAEGPHTWRPEASLSPTFL